MAQLIIKLHYISISYCSINNQEIIYNNRLHRKLTSRTLDASISKIDFLLSQELKSIN